MPTCNILPMIPQSQHAVSSTKDTSDESTENQHIRRLEQWSSLDSCVIPNRTRIPTGVALSDLPVAPRLEDSQIASNLLEIESRIKPSERTLARESAIQSKLPDNLSDPFRDRSSQTKTSSNSSNPFRSRTSSDSNSDSKDGGSSLVSSSKSGSITLAPEELSARHFTRASKAAVAPALQQLDGNNENIPPIRDEQQHSRKDDPKTGRDAPSAPRIAESSKNNKPKRLRSSATCPDLPKYNESNQPMLTRSSRSAFNLLRSSSISNLTTVGRDAPFKDQSVGDLVRKLGTSAIKLPASLARPPITLPICYARPINYLIDIGKSKWLPQPCNSLNIARCRRI